MVLNQFDVKECVIGGKFGNQLLPGENEKFKRTKKVELKPFHLLLIMYGLIALAGLIFNITS